MCLVIEIVVWKSAGAVISVILAFNSWLLLHGLAIMLLYRHSPFLLSDQHVAYKYNVHGILSNPLLIQIG